MWTERSKIVENLYSIVVNFLSAKIDYYNYKIFYVSSMATTKSITIEGTLKKMRKIPKHVTSKN